MFRFVGKIPKNDLLRFAKPGRLQEFLKQYHRFRHFSAKSKPTAFTSGVLKFEVCGVEHHARGTGYSFLKFDIGKEVLGEVDVHPIADEWVGGFGAMDADLVCSSGFQS